MIGIASSKVWNTPSARVPYAVRPVFRLQDHPARGAFPGHPQWPLPQQSPVTALGTQRICTAFPILPRVRAPNRPE